MQTAPITPATPAPAQSGSAADATTSAFGLGFDALLKIILTQLSYQDPLKPMDNFQFVSQLAQFSQVQQGQVTNERLASLVAAQAAGQAAGLLGRYVDVPAGSAVVSGTVSAVALSNGTPTVTIETDDRRTISGIAISTISQIREKQ
ncbi:flagellar hook assembly protein FlgD [Sphingomonas silueang]|uniref:flagellar hook assembly protein FlgD n=1 Tax=Sphingomonas silueang TaxID=3156617 RepID=UPI0032B3A57B